MRENHSLPPGDENENNSNIKFPDAPWIERTPFTPFSYKANGKSHGNIYLTNEE